MVGVVGFEPTTSCSQSTCATTAPHPEAVSRSDRAYAYDQFVTDAALGRRAVERGYREGLLVSAERAVKANPSRSRGAAEPGHGRAQWSLSDQPACRFRFRPRALRRRQDGITSVSFGRTGLRHTVGTGGRRRTSTGIPGTGFSVFETSGRTKKAPSQPAAQRHGGQGAIPKRCGAASQHDLT